MCTNVLGPKSPATLYNVLPIYHSYLQVLVNIFCCVNIGRTTHYEINYSNHSLVVVGYLYVGLI